jgi:hypothetical protein
MDSTHNPLVLAYLLTTIFRHDIILATPDYRGGELCGHTGDTAADTKYVSCQRNTNMINAEAAWWYEVGDPSIIVGIADGGVDYRHPDFGDSVLGVGHKFQVAWNFDYNSGASHVYDNGGHGTQMAGILGALTNNMLGAPFYDQTVAGIAGGWGSLTTTPMHPIRGRGVTIDVAASSIEDGYSPYTSSLFEMSARSPNSPYGWGVHTINISEGLAQGLFPISPPHAGINYAFENRVVCCAAMHEAVGAGQGDSTTIFEPADYEDPWVLAVGGSIPDKSKVPQSDYGQTMDLLAPAGSSLDACGTGWLANYTTHADVPGAFTFNGSGGTSAACANATGSVALLLSHFHRMDTLSFQNLEPEDYQGILKASAWRRDGGRLSDTSLRNSWRDSSGWGHLDIGKAFEMLDSDRSSYPHSGYKIYHYKSSDTTSMSFGAWTNVPQGSCAFGPAENPNMTHFPDSVGSIKRRYQLDYTAVNAQFRIVTLSTTLPDVWDRTDSVPLFAWGRSGGPLAKSGWNLSSPFNFETGWTQVLNGTGWDHDSLNEGIFHNGGSTFVLRTGQWKIKVNDSTFILAPPDSELGMNFTVFGRTSSTSSVAHKSPIIPGELDVSVAKDGAINIRFFNDKIRDDMNAEFFDILGRPIGSYKIGRVDAGWNQSSYTSRSMKAGVYMCRLSAPGYTSRSRNFVIIK